MFVVNFNALAQASDFRIERRQAVFLCWMQDGWIAYSCHWMNCFSTFFSCCLQFSFPDGTLTSLLDLRSRCCPGATSLNVLPSSMWICALRSPELMVRGVETESLSCCLGCFIDLWFWVRLQLIRKDVRRPCSAIDRKLVMYFPKHCAGLWLYINHHSSGVISLIPLAWWLWTITWANVDLSSLGFCGTCLRTISQEVLKIITLIGV